jgi:hypothetical protein
MRRDCMDEFRQRYPAEHAELEQRVRQSWKR